MLIVNPAVECEHFDALEHAIPELETITKEVMLTLTLTESFYFLSLAPVTLIRHAKQQRPKLTSSHFL